METIDDIRREDGNPRAGDAGGSPRSIFRAFSSGSGTRLAAMRLLTVGIILLLIGAMLFIAPLMMVGLFIVIVAGIGYAWAKFNSYPRGGLT